MQVEEKKWVSGIPAHEAKGHANYGAFIAWKEAQPRCWPSLEAAAEDFYKATGLTVTL